MPATVRRPAPPLELNSPVFTMPEPFQLEGEKRHAEVPFSALWLSSLNFTTSALRVFQDLLDQRARIPWGGGHPSLRGASCAVLSGNQLMSLSPEAQNSLATLIHTCSAG